MTGPALPVARDADAAELARWDADAVDTPGGHVLQSQAWAAHRAAQGWRPRHLVIGEVRALALVRPYPLVPGTSAYLPRGPVGPGTPWRTDDGTGTGIGAALVAATDLLARSGCDVIAADPEVAEADHGYEVVLERARFHAIPEIQPSRHRMALDLPPGTDADTVFDGVAKATRQRIRRAERDGVVVVRHDLRAAAVDADARAGSGPGFALPAEDAAVALERFYSLLRETGDRRGFGFAGPSEFVTWWNRAFAAGHLAYLEAREHTADGDVLGGLVLYRHGRRLSTAHSGDRAERRRDHPGAMHLLRWRAIELALAEGCTEMDLGGVDIAGARRPPVDGEPTYGLYEHKRSFGARWVQLAGAREIVVRPLRYRVGRVASKLARTARRAPGGRA